MPKPCFVGIDRFLKEKYGQVNQTTLAGYIDESQPAYSNFLNGTSNLSSKAVYKYVKKIYELGIVEGRKQNAENLFNALEDIHGSGCAKNLLNGNSNASKASSLSNYKNGKATISKKQYQNLFGKHSSKIFNPIIEFMECAPQKKGQTWKLFRDNKSEKDIQKKLSDEISAKVGVYAMYDSSGRIIYFGKTNNGLYSEITQRLSATVHRDVALVRKGQFKHLGNPGKSDKTGMIQVGEMTKYITAVEVCVPEAIKNIEAFVLRLIPNDDVNYKIENYEF